MRRKKTELTEKFGLKVKIERIKKHLSQDKLAELANLSQKSVCDIENGITTPSIETVNALAKAMGISLLEIMDIENFN